VATGFRDALPAGWQAAKMEKAARSGFKPPAEAAINSKIGKIRQYGR
jgi:hypothetical protein